MCIHVWAHNESIMLSLLFVQQQSANYSASGHSVCFIAFRVSSMPVRMCCIVSKVYGGGNPVGDGEVSQ